ncbi:hypothetical protein DOTSEDRAFT_69898 [Dothistroma septosporum NZE10]|uniref:Uncharacterized protein n=1 Tax=Dothistroma septosporum (strain NZE10 / CBS 128990) TaxID=675120 RepID=N1PXI2_DOTSN|nr:hypothetical protein DOTSEDRAFT_69898 [Dothistroma septosporum NZE10]
MQKYLSIAQTTRKCLRCSLITDASSTASSVPQATTASDRRPLLLKPIPHSTTTTRAQNCSTGVTGRQLDPEAGALCVSIPPLDRSQSLGLL